jgi:CRISPR/Cas system-associated exonuclease Cas4 (RecB family)
MGKSVAGGKLLQVSPSSINAFDSSSAWGCPRRWFFKYVLGWEEPSTGSQQLGTNLHAMNEEYLLTGKHLLSTEQATTLFRRGLEYLDSIKPDVVAVEAPVAGEVAGVPLKGYCDVVTKWGIIDWKTSKNLGRYGKKGFELKKDTQMLLYARTLLPDLESWKLVHGQYQTEGANLFQLAETRITRAELDTHCDNVIIPLVEKMKSAASEKEVENLSRQPEDKCRRCPFKDRCPNEESEIMSFLNRFKKSVEAPVAETPAPVLPPDAPESKPELAAKPVEGFERRKMNIVDVVPEPEVTAPAAPEPVVAAPAPEPTPPPPAPVAVADAPKRRGRPPKNSVAHKTELPGPVVAAPIASTVTAASISSTATSQHLAAVAVEAKASRPAVVVRKVTLTHGLTINMGNFNSARVDVTLEGDVGDDLQAAFELLSKQVKEKLVAETEEYLKQAQLKVTK